MLFVSKVYYLTQFPRLPVSWTFRYDQCITTTILTIWSTSSLVSSSSSSSHYWQRETDRQRSRIQASWIRNYIELSSLSIQLPPHHFHYHFFHIRQWEEVKKMTNSITDTDRALTLTYSRKCRWTCHLYQWSCQRIHHLCGQSPETVHITINETPSLPMSENTSLEWPVS